jgi:hypothetical protein
VLDYRKAAFIDGSRRGGVDQFQKIAAIRRVQPPRFTVKAALRRSQYGGAYSIFLRDELKQTMLVFLGTGDVAVQLSHPSLYISVIAKRWLPCYPSRGRPEGLQPLPLLLAQVTSVHAKECTPLTKYSLITGPSSGKQSPVSAPSCRSRHASPLLCRERRWPRSPRR